MSGYRYAFLLIIFVTISSITNAYSNLSNFENALTGNNCGIIVSKEKIDFKRTVNDTLPISDVITVATTAQNGFEWEFLEGTGINWLEVTQDKSIDGTEDCLTLTVLPVSLFPKKYYAYVKIYLPGESESCVNIPVTLNVIDPDLCWPMYQRDASHRGHIPITIDPSMIECRWSRQFYDDSTNCGSSKTLPFFTVAENTVYVTPIPGHGENNLYAIDSQSGDIVWTQNFDNILIESPPSYYQGNVYLQIKDDAGYLRSFNSQTGTLEFSSTYGSQTRIVYNPTIYDGVVYTPGGYTTGLNAFDAYTGSLVWYTPNFRGQRTTPCVNEQYIFTYTKILCMYDRLTGERLFNFDETDGGNNYHVNQTPVIGSKDQIMVVANDSLFSFDIGSRLLKWKVAGDFDPQISLAQGVIYGINDGILEAYDESRGTLLWSWSHPKKLLTAPVIVTDSHVFINSDDYSNLFAINLETKICDCKLPFGGTMAMDHNTLYIGGAHYTLKAFTVRSESEGLLDRIEIQGPQEVGDQYVYTYKAIAYYNNGESINITNQTEWKLSESYDYCELQGNDLNISRVNSSSHITINAQYIEDNNLYQAECNVLVHPYIPIKSVPSQFPTIQSAIDEARENDVIIVEPGVYQGDGNWDINYLGKAITVQSVNPDDPNIVNSTIIDCDDLNGELHNGFNFISQETSDSHLIGLTIQNGYGRISCIPSDPSASYGGGVLCYGSSPTISKCIIRNNYAELGAGIGCHNSDALISNCLISENMGQWAAGISVVGDSNVTVKDCIVQNHLVVGIGTYCPIKIDNTMIRNNETGINIVDTSAQISRCTIECNRKGVLAVDGSESILKSCLFNNNSVYGMAVNDYYPFDNIKVIAFLENCTFVNNPIGLQVGPMTVANISNSIFWSNTDYDIRTYGKSPECNIEYSNIERGWDGVGDISTDPLFFDNSTCFNLQTNSPCINSGDPNIIVDANETDLSGIPRIMNDRIDMGAYEANLPIVVEVDIQPSVLNLSSKGNWITCNIKLPATYDVSDIDPMSILLENKVPAEAVKIHEPSNNITVKFDRMAVQKLSMGAQIPPLRGASKPATLKI